MSTWYGRLTKKYANKLFGFIETQDIRSFECHMQATSQWDAASVQSFLDSPKGEGPRALALTVVASARDQSTGRANERVRTYLQSISAACPAITLKVSNKNYLLPCRDIPKVAVHVASVICGRLRLTHLCKLCRALHCLRFFSRGRDQRLISCAWLAVSTVAPHVLLASCEPWLFVSGLMWRYRRRTTAAGG